MSECYCDYDESWRIYEKRTPVAKKAHKCSECGAPIRPGEKYENVFGISSDGAYTYKTCQNCAAARDYLLAHVPCMCWYHGNLISDIKDTLFEYADQAPGLAFAVGRHLVRGRQAKRATMNQLSGEA